jgi:hypothetical protein
VASSRIPNFGSRGPQTIYITSEEFGITVPLDAELEEPAGVFFYLPDTGDFFFISVQGDAGLRGTIVGLPGKMCA